VSTTAVTRGRRRPGRPSAGEAAADGEALLECAERLIRREGPDVTIEAIAAEAGVTKPIVYHHVGGKDALVEHLAWRLNARHGEASRRAVAGVTDPAKAIRAFVEAHLAQIESDRNLYFYVTGASAGGRGSPGVLSFADRSAAGLARTLAALRRRSGHPPAAALPWAYGVIGMLHFVALWWLRDADRSRSELTDQLTDLLWTGLRGKGTSARARPAARRRARPRRS
jgi:AcrR family transcriptional regulator